MAFVISIVLLVAVTILFHIFSPWWLTDIASNWSSIDLTIDITVWVTGVVFIAINLFMAYAVYRYRYRKNRRAQYEPENAKLELWLTIFTSVGVAAMLAPGLFVWANFVTVPDEAMEVEVVGQQWQWSFRYPGQDGVLGTVDSVFVSPDNPFGMNPEDPFGQDDILVASKEMHLPVDVPVKFLLRSKDVLHNYTVAQFRVKMDLVPGAVSYMWLTPTVTGSYDILCEELCGVGHHIMRGVVVVESQDEYENWLAQQSTFAQTQTAVAGDPNLGQPAYALCAACHGVNGEGNTALNGPKLAGQESWYLRSQINYYRNGVRGAHPEDIYGAQMAPMVATLIDEAAVNNVVAYIQTLPDEPVAETVIGSVARGQAYYTETCSVCHGERGEGVWSVHAPGLAGMSDWYLVRQLQYFKSGIRGAHPQDQLGHQMRSMVSALRDDEAINDVVAYINTFR